MNAPLRHHRPPLTRIRHAIALIAMIGFVAIQLQATSYKLQALFFIPTAHAAPGIYKPIHYQGKVSQIGGSPVSNGSYNMQFKLYDAATNGTLLWTETWNSGTSQVTMTGGLFSVALGTHTAMTNVNFNTDSLYLQVEFDPGNDGTYEEVFSPRRRMASVPYAHNADRLDGLDSTQLLRTDQANITTGSLLVNTGGLAIRTPGTISGGTLHASNMLTSSGGLRILQGSTAAGINIDQNGNGIALNIDTESTTQNGLDIQADALTSGGIARLYSNSASNTARTLLSVINDNAAATAATALSIQQDAATKGFFIDQNGNGIAIDIDTESTTANGLDIQADALTSGGIMRLYSNSASNTARTLLSVINDNAAAVNATALSIQQDAATGGLFIDQNGNGIALDIDSEATNQPGLRISMPTTDAAANPHILFGYANTFDAKLYRSGVAQLSLKAETATGNADVFRILSNVTTTNNLVFRIESDGDVRADGTVQGGGADYAEWFASRDTLLPGEVVCIDVERRNTVKRCDRDGDPNVMGIISTKPAFVGNAFWGLEGIQPPGYALVGLIGQVSTLVTDEGGPIRPGDSLTASSVPGKARKAQAGESTVGVALEGLEVGTGTINVLISRRNQSLTVEAVEEKIVERISAMEIEDEVRLMVSEALGDLTVEDDITAAVQTQIDALQFHNTLDELRQRIDAIEARDIASATGAVQTPHGASPPSASGGILQADMLELQDTLLVGTDARIGGDLYLDGSLIMESLYVPGSIDIENTVHAGRIDAGSGSRIAGTLILDGELRMGTGSIRYQSGAIAITDLLVEHSVFILGDITIEGLARFLGVVEIAGELRLPTKQAGRTRILAGESKVEVRFGTGFSAVPIVTVSPEDFATSSWRVQPVTATGFTIELQRKAYADIGFAWHAFVTVEDDATPLPESIDPNQPIPFPVDSLGVPVSSDAVWNACIRSVAMTDTDGQSFDCTPFHDDATWRHPDLHISFIWNDKLTPSFLQIPPGYVLEETDSAANVATGFTRKEPGSEEGQEGQEGPDDESTTGGTGTTIPLPQNSSGTTVPQTDDADSPTPEPAPTATASSTPAQPTDPAPAVESPPMTPAKPAPAPQEPVADASPPPAPPSEEPPMSTTMP